MSDWKARLPKVEYFLEFCIYLYVCSLFITSAMAPQRIGLWLGFLAWVFFADKSYLKRVLANNIFRIWLVLLSWLILTSVLSAFPKDALEALRGRLDDHVLILPQFIHVFANPAARRRVLLMLGLASLISTVDELHLYFKEWYYGLSHLQMYGDHRWWGYVFAFFLPFTIVCGVAFSKYRVLWWLLGFLQVVLVVATGSRGAWLAIAAAGMLPVMMALKRKQTIAVLLSACVLGVVSYAFLPDYMVSDRIKQGFDTSLRTTGTWGPTIEMTNQRPLIGYGFGAKVYNDEFNRQVDGHPDWSFRTSPTPHSLFLATAFAAGYPALILLLMLVFGLVLVAWKGFKHGEGPDRYLCLGVLSSCAGFYLVRGWVETVMWEPMSILIGILVGLAVAKGVELSKTAPVLLGDTQAT